MLLASLQHPHLQKGKKKKKKKERKGKERKERKSPRAFSLPPPLQGLQSHLWFGTVCFSRPDHSHDVAAITNWSCSCARMVGTDDTDDTDATLASMARVTHTMPCPWPGPRASLTRGVELEGDDSGCRASKTLQSSYWLRVVIRSASVGGDDRPSLSRMCFSELSGPE